MKKHTLSLPEYVLGLTPKETPEFVSSSVRQNLQIVVAALKGSYTTHVIPPVRRHIIGPDLAALVHTTNAIDIKDILAALAQTPYRPDTFWIQGDYKDMAPDDQSSHAPIQGQRGYLCKATSDGIYDLYPVRHYDLHGDGIGKVSIGRKQTITATALQQSDELLENFERNSKASSYITSEGVLYTIDMNHRTMDFLARTLLVLASPVLPNSVWQPETPAELVARREEYHENKRRIRAGKLPILSLAPVTIDTTRAPESGGKKELKALSDILGTINVSPSRPWVNRRTGELRRTKKGNLITTSAHKRNVASPVDRSTAPRVLTASKSVKLVLTPDHPVLRPKGPNGPKRT